jgi:hypothetical protein
MMSALDDARAGSKSMRFRSDRYTRLDMPDHDEIGWTEGHSRSMQDLSSSSPANHKEWMSKIKKDLDQFSREQGKGEAPSAVDGSPESSDRSQIPKVSSRWNQFMCEDDRSDSEEEAGVALTYESTTHILADRSTIAKFTL